MAGATLCYCFGSMFLVFLKDMIVESPLKWGDHGDNFMRSYVERSALFLSKLGFFTSNYFSNVESPRFSLGLGDRGAT